MHKTVRFQLHIMWRNVVHNRLELFLVFGILLSITDMKMVAQFRYNRSSIKICNNYIPFETVLKTNFILQEQIINLTNEL